MNKLCHIWGFCFDCNYFYYKNRKNTQSISLMRLTTVQKLNGHLMRTDISLDLFISLVNLNVCVLPQNSRILLDLTI